MPPKQATLSSLFVVVVQELDIERRVVRLDDWENSMFLNAYVLVKVLFESGPDIQRSA